MSLQGTLPRLIGWINVIKKVPITSAGNYQVFIKQSFPYLLLLMISLPVLALHLDVYPPIWLDEGYRINAARTLAERGIYGTYTTTGYLPFDPGISSGPIDIIPIALSFRLLGIGVAEARLIIILFTLLALFSLYATSVYIYGHAAGLFIILVLLAIPPIGGVSFLLIGRQVLGEAPSLAMVMLGLWLWFRSWEDEGWLLTLMAGLAFGLGLLSKMQVSIALLPSLALIATARGLKNRSQFAKLLTPLVITAGIIGAWMLLGRIGTTEQIRQENSLMLFDAIRSNLLTGLFGRTLNTSALVILAIMSMGVLVSGWRLRTQSLGARPFANARWAEATIALFVLFSALWFAFFSVGWPRYAYAGLTASLLLFGKLSWDTFQQARRWIGRLWPALDSYAYTIALVGLALIVILVNVQPILQFEEDYKAQQMADYIRTEIPRYAVIESWEWELDALSSHWEYHHPHQRYLFLAIRQFSHEQRPFDLDYDVLQADPDYLVTGPFSNWTRIYDPEVIETDFVELSEIGVYRIYKRIR
jgi:4-amino-4-deoxy-L-arabinose transferase-like glycosyltransferase